MLQPFTSILYSIWNNLHLNLSSIHIKLIYVSNTFLFISCTTFKYVALQKNVIYKKRSYYNNYNFRWHIEHAQLTWSKTSKLRTIERRWFELRDMIWFHGISNDINKYNPCYVGCEFNIAGIWRLWKIHESAHFQVD